jgi:hypothetical protein
MQDSFTIRRRRDGTINFEAYREEALRLRAESTRHFLGYLGRAGRPLVGVMAVVAACAFFLPRNTPPGCTSPRRAPLAISHCVSDAQTKQETPKPSRGYP